jgi:hypothetical protein
LGFIAKAVCKISSVVSNAFFVSSIACNFGPVTKKWQPAVQRQIASQTWN